LITKWALQKLDYSVKADTGIVAMAGAGMATMRVTSLPNVVSRDNGNRVTFHPYVINRIIAMPKI
jgi:hypothetical protein